MKKLSAPLLAGAAVAGIVSSLPLLPGRTIPNEVSPVRLALPRTFGPPAGTAAERAALGTTLAQLRDQCRAILAHPNAPEMVRAPDDLERICRFAADPGAADEASLKAGMLLGLLGAGIIVFVLTVAIGLFQIVRGLVQQHMEARQIGQDKARRPMARWARRPVGRPGSTRS